MYDICDDTSIAHALLAQTQMFNAVQVCHHILRVHAQHMLSESPCPSTPDFGQLQCGAFTDISQNTIACPRAHLEVHVQLHTLVKLSKYTTLHFTD